MIPTIMGILNVTPDSFSDGGRYVDLDAAVEHARDMIDAGASCIDVGGESTRPGAEPVSVAEELDRVVPVIGAISGLGARVSIDTRHGEVAAAAIDAGATLINDISATLWPVAAQHGAGWIAMHMAGEPGSMQQHIPSYDDVCGEVLGYLVDCATAATQAGVSEIWIDPGFGFGKSPAHNVELVANIDRFVASGYDVVLGVSRKSTLGVLCAEADGTAAPPDPLDRREPAIAMATWAMMAGVKMIRVHDVGVHVAALHAVAEAVGAPSNLAVPITPDL